MAFEQHIEADRVDDLGFVATFLRAPVVGSLMWILERGNKNQSSQEPRKPPCGETDSELPRPSLSSRRNPKELKGMPLRLIDSDVSEFSDCTKTLTTNEEERNLKSRTRPSRSLSWSDESGHDLVEFIGEEANKPTTESSAPPPMTIAKPIKSSLRRSRSATKETLEAAAATTQHCAQDRYLPKGLGGGHCGLLMPTRPGNSSGSPSFSPEWGWYISTPPTPEMYQQAVPKNNPPLPPASSHVVAGFKASSTAQTGMGWPGVPL